MLKTKRGMNLWVAASPLIIWAIHFLCVYITAAIWCAKFWVPGKNISFLYFLIAVYSIAALFGIIWLGLIGYSYHREGDTSLPHSDSTVADRNRFLGFITFIISGLSVVATIYTWYAAIVFRSCY